MNTGFGINVIMAGGVGFFGFCFSGIRGLPEHVYPFVNYLTSRLEHCFFYIKERERKKVSLCLGSASRW